jgi:nucleotide-binding universal stress UspA family protein
MFMERWHSIGARTGTIHTNWNQVRQSNSGGNNGTRTGRPSTTDPNFLNLSKTWYDKNDGYSHPKHMRSLIELPLVRKYILPDPGHVFCHRDYSQQELRLLAHFEDHDLLKAYNENPRMDVHEFVAQAIFDILGLHIERRAAKAVNFGMLYGMGLGALSESMDTDVQTAKRIKAAQLSALPGLRQLQDEGALRALLSAVQEAREPGGPAIFLKVAPDLGQGEPDQIVRAAIEHGIDAIIVANTTVSRPRLKSRYADEQGGLSGVPLKGLALKALRDFRAASGGELPLIGVGGIADADDAWERIRAGASLVQVYSAMVYDGPGIARRIARGLAQHLEREGFASIGEAVGSERP